MLLSGTLAPSFSATVIFFHQGYLIDLRGYDPLVFAAAFPVMAVTTIMFGLVCGHLIDRFGALRLLPFFLLPLSVASAAVGDRKSVVSGQSVSVRVDLGGRRIIKQKK